MADNYSVIAVEGERTFRAIDLDGIMFPVSFNEQIGNIDDPVAEESASDATLISLLKGLLSYYTNEVTAFDNPFFGQDGYSIGESASRTYGRIDDGTYGAFKIDGTQSVFKTDGQDSVFINSDGSSLAYILTRLLSYIESTGTEQSVFKQLSDGASVFRGSNGKSVFLDATYPETSILELMRAPLTQMGNIFSSNQGGDNPPQGPATDPNDDSANMAQIWRGILGMVGGTLGNPDSTENPFFYDGVITGKPFLRAILEALGDIQTNASGVAINDMLWDDGNTQPFLQGIRYFAEDSNSLLIAGLLDGVTSQPLLQLLFDTIGKKDDVAATNFADDLSLMAHVKYQSQLLAQIATNTTP